jgi:ribosomal protein S18 acetylase RimI-like enzyme
LLNAFVAEARSRGVRQIWVASYDFQAPGMYEKAGFKRMAELEGWPEGHVNVTQSSEALACTNASRLSQAMTGRTVQLPLSLPR